MLYNESATRHPSVSTTTKVTVKNSELQMDGSHHRNIYGERMCPSSELHGRLNDSESCAQCGQE